MGKLLWTVRTTNPRTAGFISTDKTVLTTRTNTAASWQSLWDNTYLPYCDTLVGQSDATVVSPDDLVHHKFFMLGYAGWIENSTTYHNKLLSVAKHLAQSVTWEGWTAKRSQVLGSAYAYDFLKTAVITFSDADKKIIGDKLISEADYTTTQEQNEKIDGHTGGNYMAMLHAAVALRGESGSGFNYTTTADSRINKVLDFWFGASPSDVGRIDTDRFFGGDGGGVGKGPLYNGIANWHTLWLLRCLKSGFSALDIDLGGGNTEPYDPWVYETWVGKIPEYYIHAYFRGDGDFLSVGDTGRVSVPWFLDDQRHAMQILIDKGGALRKQIRWQYDQIQAYENAAPPNGAGLSTGAYRRAYDVAAWDPADAANVSQSPAAAGTEKSRLFTPFGDYFHVSSHDPAEKTIVHIRCPEFFYEGHPHLDCGGMQIFVKGDCVLVGSGGTYGNSWYDSTGGPHNIEFHQNSIAHSGLILINDGATTPHKAQMRTTETGSANRQPVRAGLGGQYRKEFDEGGGNIIYDPPNIDRMRNDGGALAWRRSGIDAAGTHRFRIVERVAGSHTFLHADVRRAYLLRHTHFDTASDRTKRVDRKWLVIEAGSVWQYPVILQIAWVEARQATYVKRQCWRLNGPPNSQFMPDGVTRRVFSDGWRTVANANLALPRGRIYIDQYQHQQFFYEVTGSSVPTANGYFQNQFAYSQGVTPQYEPLAGSSTREQPDIGRYRIDFLQDSIAEVVYATLLFPCLRTETPPAYQWIDEPQWLGVNFGGGKEYRISKTQPIVQASGDTSPPGAPVVLSAVPGVASGQLDVALTPNVESDMDRYAAYYRSV